MTVYCSKYDNTFNWNGKTIPVSCKNCTSKFMGYSCKDVIKSKAEKQLEFNFGGNI